VLLSDVSVKAVRYFIKVVFSYSTDEAVGLHVLLYALQLVTELTEGVNDQTCGQRNLHKKCAKAVARCLP
jgi:hypothetical protein